MNVSAIIMAAGMSRRMKRNKLKMKICDKYIFEYIFETINKCRECFSEIIVVAKDEDIKRRAEKLDFKYLENEKAYFGQSSSLKMGIKNSNSKSSFMFFVADQPFIRGDTIKGMIKIYKNNPNNIIVASYNGINGNPVIFPQIFRKQLLKMEGDTGGRLIIRSNPDKVLKMEVGCEIELIDIDTMEDYEAVIKEMTAK